MTAARAGATRELAGHVGFTAPIAERKISMRRHGVELFATLALAVSLVIAGTAVSIGMARAAPAALIGGHHLSMSAFW